MYVLCKTEVRQSPHGPGPTGVPDRLRAGCSIPRQLLHCPLHLVGYDRSTKSYFRLATILRWRMWHKDLRALLPLTAYGFKLFVAIAWEKVVRGYRVLRPRVRLRVCSRGAVRKRDVRLELGGLPPRKRSWTRSGPSPSRRRRRSGTGSYGAAALIRRAILYKLFQK